MKQKTGEDTVTILLDTRKSRIRVHKETMEELGKPEYIQLLVNPRENIFALRSCDAADSLSVRIYRSGPKKGMYDFYSKRFIRELAALLPEKREGENYLIKGKVSRREKLAVFSLADSAPLSAPGEVTS